MPRKNPLGTPCCEEGCSESRAVTSSGVVLNRCRPHHTAYRRGCNRVFRGNHPEFSSVQSKKSRERHPDRKKAWDHRYYENNKERVTEVNKQWAIAHPESARAAGRKWRADHRQEKNEREKIRKAAIRLAQGITPRVIKPRPPKQEPRPPVTPEQTRERERAWYEANREHVSEKSRQWKRDNRAKVREHNRKRREADGPPYVRMDPWSTDCQICGKWIDPSRKHLNHHPDPMGPSEDHEPPMHWARNHPEYTGPYILRPAHHRCNVSKQAKPDWELKPIDKAEKGD